MEIFASYTTQGNIHRQRLVEIEFYSLKGSIMEIKLIVGYSFKPGNAKIRMQPEDDLIEFMQACIHKYEDERAKGRFVTSETI